MPVHVTYPGVYVEELPSTEKSVSGISTSATAFVDFFARGPMTDENQANAVQIFNYRDFQRTFGGLHAKSEASYAVMQFFANGGNEAWIVRCDDGSGEASSRKLEVKIPYLNDFAADASDAAVEAARAAGRARNIVNAISSVLAARDAAKAQPALGPGAAAEEALKKMPEAAPKTYDELAGVEARIQDGLDAADAALEAATLADKEKAKEADIAALREELANAMVDFDNIDTRDSEEDLEKQVAASLASARPVVEKSAAIAKGVVAYPPASAELIGKAIDAAADGVGSLRTIHYSTGWGANAAEEHLGSVGEPADNDAINAALGVVSDCLGAAGAAITLAASVTPGVDDADAVKARGAAQRAIDDARQATDEAKATAFADAVTKTKDALAAAKNIVPTEAQLNEAPSAVKKRQTAAGELGEAIQKADGEVTNARTALTAAKEAGDADKTEKTSEAILATDGAVASTEEAAKKAIELVPEDLKQDADGWPEIALAVEVAADLTFEASRKTQEAGEAADAASKVLAERVLQYEAAFGGMAEQAQKAAEGASDAALEAKQAAGEAAAEAKNAAKDVTKDAGGKELLREERLNAAKKTIIDAAEAAQKAAAKALAAADKAGDAHMAALAAGEAGAPPNLKIEAISPGVWGNNLRIAVLNGTQYQFDLLVREYVTRNGKATSVASEVFRNLSLQDENAKNFALSVVNHQSNLVRLSYKGPVVRGARPIGDGTTRDSVVIGLFQRLMNGRDGNPPRQDRLVAAMTNGLDHLAPAIFNILCLPITGTYPASEASLAISSALKYCQDKRAFMIVDIPESVRSVKDMTKWIDKYGNAANFSGAVYFPRLIMPDPLQNYRPKNVGPSGTMAGLYARTDSRRGIWKAPAGSEASLLGGVDVALKLTDDQNGQLNPRGVNCLRAFPVYGNIAWGARTLAGADQLQSEWKYVNVRRLVYYIEETLFQALKWAVFEGNDAKLWGQIRQQVGKFLSGLFADGAFAGPTPDKSYFVHCDETTTTSADIANGIVNIVVGIAPIKPAEFVILQIEQIAGQE